MMTKPKICLIDEDPKVKLGWEKALGQQATLFYFKDHLEFLQACESDPPLFSSLTCVILGKHFAHLGLDIQKSNIPDLIKKSVRCPLFLNWQGYVQKDYLNKHFDGKVFQRYGLKWHTLRLRLQKAPRTGSSFASVASHSKKASRNQRCIQLLRFMANQAEGEHRKKIEFYATKDQANGIKLLEAMYTRLLTTKDSPETCPSRYIASSPIIAAKILHEALQ